MFQNLYDMGNMAEGRISATFKVMAHNTARSKNVLFDRHLPPQLQYACSYWVYHLIQSQGPINELNPAFSFLKAHFLHWLEATSLLGIISAVVSKRLQSVMQVSIGRFTILANTEIQLGAISVRTSLLAA